MQGILLSVSSFTSPEFKCSPVYNNSIELDNETIDCKIHSDYISLFKKEEIIHHTDDSNDKNISELHKKERELENAIDILDKHFTNVKLNNTPLNLIEVFYYQETISKLRSDIMKLKELTKGRVKTIKNEKRMYNYAWYTKDENRYMFIPMKEVYPL
jgi:hypothetical protein